MSTKSVSLYPAHRDELFPELNEPAPRLLSGDDLVTDGTARAWATFSADRRYRYLLARLWDPDGTWLSCGMLNPSSAGADRDDPTIRRVVGFARRDHFGGVLVWNAAALIATNPRELTKADDPIGPRNEEAVLCGVTAPSLARVVIAWGRPINQAIARLLRRTYLTVTCRRPLHQFGQLTKAGWPRHPLYLSSKTPILPYESYEP